MDPFVEQGYMFYSLQANYVGVTHPTLASFFPAPQRYYVPARIRETYRTRLEASGLWNIPIEEVDDKGDPRRPFGEKAKKEEQDPKIKFKTAFEREKVCFTSSRLYEERFTPSQ